MKKSQFSTHISLYLANDRIYGMAIDIQRKTNRNSYAICRMVPFQMTLDDPWSDFISVTLARFATMIVCFLPLYRIWFKYHNRRKWPIFVPNDRLMTSCELTSGFVFVTWASLRGCVASLHQMLYKYLHPVVISTLRNSRWPPSAIFDLFGELVMGQRTKAHSWWLSPVKISGTSNFIKLI